jgi:serine protease Do
MQKREKIMRRAIALAVVAAAMVIVRQVPFAGAASVGDDLAALKRSGAAFASVAKKAMPAVVFIQVEKTIGGPGRKQYRYNDPFEYFPDELFERFFGPGMRQRQPRQFRQMGQGSGFLISKDGYILTNNHVVGDADKITVKTHDGREFLAKRIGTDPKSEVAVIKIEGDRFPYLELGDSTKLDVGEWVIAIGNPFGLSETLTVGVVSAKGRTGVNIADYEEFIQTDAAINPGNSGGPLLNVDAQVVGINTAIYSQNGGNMGIGFAIPSSLVSRIKDQLVKTGKVSRGYLGILLQDVTAEIAESFGLKEDKGILITDVVKDSPASKQGLKRDDVIVGLNGEKVESAGMFRNSIASTPPGTKVRIGVFRGGKEVELTVETGTLPGVEDVASASGETEDWLGFKVTDLTRESAEQLGYETGEGVLVSDVDGDGAGAQAGIQPGSLIVSVNRVVVHSAKEFGEALEKAKGRKTVLLLVRTGQNLRYVAIARK